jgi:hypothetical protein
MYSNPILNNWEIAHDRHADLLREATQARLARTARLGRRRRQRLGAAQLVSVLHLPRRRTTVVEPVANA